MKIVNGKNQFSSRKNKNNFLSDLVTGVGVKRLNPNLPQRRDTFTKKFEQDQRPI